MHLLQSSKFLLTKLFNKIVNTSGSILISIRKSILIHTDVHTKSAVSKSYTFDTALIYLPDKIAITGQSTRWLTAVSANTDAHCGVSDSHKVDAGSH